jgi:hypothetical protein
VNDAVLPAKNAPGIVAPEGTADLSAFLDVNSFGIVQWAELVIFTLSFLLRNKMVSRSRATTCSRAFAWGAVDLDLALSRCLKVPQTLKTFTHSVNRMLTSTFRRLPPSTLRNSLRRGGKQALFQLVHRCECVLSTPELVADILQRFYCC